MKKCILCGAEKVYAKSLCYRCYMRIYMREWRNYHRRGRTKTGVLKKRITSVFENLGLECPHCENTAEFYVDFERAEIICKVCGVVLVSGARFNTFYPRTEWRKR
jgi:ribosomal protein S27E